MLDAISQRLKPLEYGINKLGTLVVLVPGVSLITYNAKTAALHQKIKGDQQLDQDLLRLAEMQKKDWKKLKQINQWHILGSLAQIVAIVAWAVFKQRQLIALVSLVPTCELAWALRSSRYEHEAKQRLEKVQKG